MENTFYATSLRESFATYHPSFDELFDRFWSNFSLLSRPKVEQVESLTVEIPLSAPEAMRGGQTRVLVPGRAAVGPAQRVVRLDRAASAAARSEGGRCAARLGASERRRIARPGLRRRRGPPPWGRDALVEGAFVQAAR